MIDIADFREKDIPERAQAEQPGQEWDLYPAPESIRDSYYGRGCLRERVALITGGENGIGRAVALHFAREGAMVAIAYLDEDADALQTQRFVEAEGAQCALFSGDLAEPEACADLVARVVERYGRIDILVNNAGEQYPVELAAELASDNVQRTFVANVFSFTHVTAAAVRHMRDGASIINTSSVVAVRGDKNLLDYSASKGAVHALTMSLAQSLAERGIRVNAVAPGPIWSAVIPSSFDSKEVAEFGGNTLVKRPGQPSEVAPAYVFLASEEASYITGQTIHVNGGGLTGT